MKNEPTIKIVNSLDPDADPNPYVLVIDADDEPYNIEDLVTIIAKDVNGNDLTDSIVYDSRSVDWAKVGNYPVEVSVMDDNLNMTAVFFTIHVITKKEAKQIESGDSNVLSRRGEKEKRLQKRDAIIDKIFYILIGVVLVGFLVYTYVDAF